ncbi:hypothetical protein LINPERPRIM_LOCUS36651 [Linum perenne]
MLVGGISMVIIDLQGLGLRHFRLVPARSYHQGGTAAAGISRSRCLIRMRL